MANGKFPKPSRDYNAERRSGSRVGGGWKIAGSAFRTIGSALAQSSHSHQDATLKKHGAHVGGPFTRGSGVITSQRAKGWARKMRFIDPYRRKTIERIIDRHDPTKKWSPQQKGAISEEELQNELGPQFKKELGDKAGELVLKELSALYAGNRSKRTQADEVLKHLERTKKFMRKEQMPIARQIVKSVIIPFEAHQIGNRGITSEEVIKAADEIHAELGRKTGDEFERAFEIVRKNSTASEQETPPSKSVMGLREAMGLGGWGKRSGGNNEDSQGQDKLKKAA